MVDISRAQELILLAEEANETDPETAIEYLGKVAAIIDPVDLSDSFDNSIVGKDVNSYVTLAQEADTGTEQAVQAGIDRAKEKLKRIN